jgi:hypothetical protein
MISCEIAMKEIKPIIQLELSENATLKSKSLDHLSIETTMVFTWFSSMLFSDPFTIQLLKVPPTCHPITVLSFAIQQIGSLPIH